MYSGCKPPSTTSRVAVPFLLLSNFDVAVMVTEPSLRYVTTPLSLTVATSSFEEDQVTPWLNWPLPATTALSEDDLCK